MKTSSHRYLYRATVLNVVDGDTIDVEVDLGFSLRATHRLRLLGINTAEMHADASKERELAKTAKEETAKLVGKKVMIETEKTDSFGRYLATIFVDGEKQSFNDLMIKKGLAIPYKRDKT